MILYFTGTGNSRYVAERVAEVIGDELLDMTERVKRSDTSTVKAERLVFVTPTYAWRIPKTAEKWIGDTEFTGGKQAWFIMDCGGEIGDAAKYNKLLCGRKGFEYMGTAQVVMPENYIAMFSVPSKEKARQIIRKAEPSIAGAAQRIAEGEAFPAPRRNLYDRLMSDTVNPIFYRACVHAHPFRADDKCIGCGKCVRLCPLNNITLEDGKPLWGGNCTHCMACISYCPTEAIEYGRRSVGKPRYRCEDILK